MTTDAADTAPAVVPSATADVAPATGLLSRLRPGSGGRRRMQADQPRPPLSPARFSVIVTLVTLLGLAAWFMLYVFVLSGVQEAHQQRVEFAHIREKLALATVPIGGAIKPGTPVALLSIPQLDQHNVVVTDGTSSSQLENGPGHLPDTPLPGQAGYSVFYGRSTTFGAPFGSLHKLKPGDAINISTGQGTFSYAVTDLRVPGDPEPASLPAGSSGLVLVTSQAHGISDAWAPGQVLYVDAHLTRGAVQPTPSGRPTSVAAVDEPFHSDDGNLIPLALWLQLLVAFVAATAWAWLRWGKPQTWLVAVPAGLAILWGAMSALAPLLPNLS